MLYSPYCTMHSVHRRYIYINHKSTIITCKSFQKSKLTNIVAVLVTVITMFTYLVTNERGEQVPQVTIRIVGSLDFRR